MNSWICYKDLVKRNMANGDDKGNPLELLPFKRSVTMSLLARGLNSEKQGAGRIGRLAPKIHPSAQIKNKRRKVSTASEKSCVLRILAFTYQSSLQKEDGVNGPRVFVSGR